MATSEQIGELAAALVSAQSEFSTVPKDSNNPYFKSKYAALPEVIQTASPVLAKHGLAVSQFLGTNDQGDTLTTWLIHKSGQYINDTMQLHLSKNDAQGQGSATTYARRYAYMSALGLVADEDDDGNAASRPKAATKPVEPPKVETGLIHPTLMTELRNKLRDAGMTGDNATAFVESRIGKPAPVTNKDVQDVIEGLDILLSEEAKDIEEQA